MPYPLVVIYNERGSVYDVRHKTARGRAGHERRNPAAVVVDVFCPGCGERCWRSGGCAR
ncbi:MAG TPA: hypothetical protein VD931_12490 [Baekduia sp.]|nr:hypothetical protein [Baekduia sp.]